jgi:ATP-dependent DNA helicase RecG
MELTTPLSEISGFQQRFILKLKRLGVTTVKDLLWHFPTRYEDFSQIYKIADLIPNQEATIRGRVEEIEGRRAWRRNLYIVECLVSDDTGSIKVVWFNQPYIRNVLQPGRLANFSGKVSGREELHLSNPTYELVRDENAETRHTARIVPVYPETRGLTSKGIRYIVKPILDNLKNIPESLPEDILKKQDLPELNRAIRQIHFPDELGDALRARKRFAFEDLFLLQLYNLKQKIALAKNKSPAIEADIPFVKDLLEHLPFTLTLSQKKSLWEILKDLSRSQPMNRLLQGDVGSGKTVIAAIAALNTAHHGYQTALMAPTEILARQHYLTFVKFFPEFDGGAALITASKREIFYGHGLTAEPGKKQLMDDIGNGKLKIVIGTHALLQKGVNFKSPALVIVDEQHRFGVGQRAELSKQKNGMMPHFLSMSATPIPRTLSLTIFGDLDLSLISELPKNRKPIITKTVAPEERAETYRFIRREIKNGRQVFVICPRIEPAEQTETPLSWAERQKLDLKSVKEEYEKLSKKIFPDLKILMLHGKMPAKGGSASGGKASKENVMKDFLEGKADILVSTSVVEVGVDVPNATVMLIEGADRFGLAQLYQFRGRVGRGEHQSYCFLFTDSSSSSTKQRLKSIVEARNGFELAEKDLKQRGPGEFFGQTQSGMPDIAMQAIQNPEMVKETREAAIAVIKNDPNLKKHPFLSERMTEFRKQIHWE